MPPGNKPHQSVNKAGQEIAKLDLGISFSFHKLFDASNLLRIRVRSKKNKNKLVIGIARVIRYIPQSTSVVVKGGPKQFYLRSVFQNKLVL